MNDVPEILEEPLLRSSSLFGLEIPLVSLKVPKISGTNLRKGSRGRTEDPRWVHWPWYIPYRRKSPLSSNDIHEGCRTDRECSELIAHGQLAVRVSAAEQSEGS